VPAAAGGMTNDDLVRQLLDALDERGAPSAIVLADLMRLEKSLGDSLAMIRRLIDSIVRRSAPSDFPDT
jgi:hypothetical protein